MKIRDAVNWQLHSVCSVENGQQVQGFSLLKHSGCWQDKCPPAFEIRNKIITFLQDAENTSKGHFCVLKLLVQGYPCKTLSNLSSLNLSVQAKIL